MDAKSLLTGLAEQPLDYLLVKLVSRCNLNCDYCYWFRDKDVYNGPPIMSDEVAASLVSRLQGHLETHSLSRFSFLFHGGEPLLIGKHRFSSLCRDLRRTCENNFTAPTFAVTTNGTLIDEEWVSIFRTHSVSVTVSIDGPAHIHDRHRFSHSGAPTSIQCVRALDLCREGGIEPGVIAVCDPSSDPIETVDYFCNNLRLKAFDILVPDATHADKPASIYPYYSRLFAEWFKNYSVKGVEIRLLHSFIRGVLGLDTHSESIGFGPITTATILADGSIEPLDVLRTAGSGKTHTGLNLRTNKLQDIRTAALWQEIASSSITLAQKCQSCRHMRACGGGHFASRWSPERGYDNESVYCPDFLRIFDEVSNYVYSGLTYEVVLEHIGESGNG